MSDGRQVDPVYAKREKSRCILYLYTEVMGYTLATIRELIGLGFEVHVVHWDDKKLSGFKIPEIPGLHLYPRSSLSAADLQHLSHQLAPDIVVVSGWQDRGYLSICRTLRASRTPVVCGFDDQWFGTWRQRVGSMLACGGYFDRFFSHAWVTGPRQFEYARRFGFAASRILFDLYAGDVELFSASYRRARAGSVAPPAHRFLFVGRLEPIKGVLTLLESWNALRNSRGDWELVIVGAGSLRAKLEGVPGIRLAGFLQPLELTAKADEAGCFVLPSLGEPWGVVIHEFAAAGLPIVTSGSVGAASAFVINGYNGFLVPAGDASALTRSMQAIMDLPAGKHREMSDNSHRLSGRITPRTSAYNLLAAALDAA